MSALESRSEIWFCQVRIRRGFSMLHTYIRLTNHIAFVTFGELTYNTSILYAIYLLPEICGRRWCGHLRVNAHADELYAHRVYRVSDRRMLAHKCKHTKISERANKITSPRHVRICTRIRQLVRLTRGFRLRCTSNARDFNAIRNTLTHPNARFDCVWVHITSSSFATCVSSIPWFYQYAKDRARMVFGLAGWDGVHLGAAYSAFHYGVRDGCGVISAHMTTK